MTFLSEIPLGGWILIVLVLLSIVLLIFITRFDKKNVPNNSSSNTNDDSDGDFAKAVDKLTAFMIKRQRLVQPAMWMIILLAMVYVVVMMITSVGGAAYAWADSDRRTIIYREAHPEYLKGSLYIPLDGSYAKNANGQRGIVVSPGVHARFDCPDCVGKFILEDDKGNTYPFKQGKPLDIGETFINCRYTIKFDPSNINRDKVPQLNLWERKKMKKQ